MKRTAKGSKAPDVRADMVTSSPNMSPPEPTGNDGPSAELPEDLKPFAIQTLLQKVVDGLEVATNDAARVPGLSTGFHDLDRLVGKLQPGELTVIGGRPAMGKTSLAVGIGLHCAVELGLPVLYFSTTMDRHAVTRRFLCAAGMLEGSRIRKFAALLDNEWDKAIHAIGKLFEASIYVCDQHDSIGSILHTDAVVHDVHSKLGLIIVDGIQGLSSAGTSSDREVETGHVVRQLKKTAAFRQIPVVVTTQLGRNLETRQNKRPVLADIRDSGQVEETADIVLMLYRDQYYNADTRNPGVAEVAVAKHNCGRTGVTQLTFLEEYGRFENYAYPGSY